VQRGTDGTRTTSLASGMIAHRTDGPDWRFGMLAAVAVQLSLGQVTHPIAERL
jgi:hypothetical protein